MGSYGTLSCTSLRYQRYNAYFAIIPLCRQLELSSRAENGLAVQSNEATVSSAGTQDYQKSTRAISSH